MDWTSGQPDNRTVDRPLEIHGPATLIDRVAVEIGSMMSSS
jgi:hypothetical protein